MTLKAFKDKFRLISDNDFEDAYDAWFELAGCLHLMKVTLPSNRKYKPGKGYVLNPDSPFHEDFKALRVWQLMELESFVFRYMMFLDKYSENSRSKLDTLND